MPMFCNALSALARLALAVVDKSAVYVVVRPLVTAFTVTSGEPCTTDFSALTVYSVAPVAASVALETVVFAPCFTAVLAAAAAVLTSPILAALLSVVPPLATLVIGLLPALMPVLVTLGPPVMFRPSEVKVLSPATTLGDAWAAGDGQAVVVHGGIAGFQAACIAQIHVLRELEAQCIAGVIGHHADVVVGERASGTASHVEGSAKLAFHGGTAVAVEFERIGGLGGNVVELAAVDGIGGRG